LAVGHDFVVAGVGVRTKDGGIRQQIAVVDRASGAPGPVLHEYAGYWNHAIALGAARDVVYIMLGRGGLLRAARTSGDVLWDLPLEVPGIRSVVPGHERVFLAAMNGAIYLVEGSTTL
jgi:hypothetical protein